LGDEPFVFLCDGGSECALQGAGSRFAYCLDTQVAPNGMSAF
jgi:hypothetical protein